MNAWKDVLWGLLRMGAVAAGVFYLGQVLVTYAKSEGRYRPVIDRSDRLSTAQQSLLWVGVVLVGMVVRLARPFVDMLAEASAEVGEWALARQQSHPLVRPRSH
ncbi:MAG TPA: hypothetical protein VL523_04985 [Terriglobia bacterium]|nr:hypothetical protein [Terriglobia bacterium]